MRAAAAFAAAHAAGCAAGGAARALRRAAPLQHHEHQHGAGVAPECPGGCLGLGPGGACVAVMQQGGAMRGECGCATGYVAQRGGAAAVAEKVDATRRSCGGGEKCCIATCALLSSASDCPRPAPGTSCQSVSAAGCRHEACCDGTAAPGGTQPPTVTGAAPVPGTYHHLVPDNPPEGGAGGDEGWVSLPAVNFAVQWEWLRAHAYTVAAIAAESVGAAGADSVRIDSVAVCTAEYHICVDKPWAEAQLPDEKHHHSNHGPAAPTQSSYLRVKLQLRRDDPQVSAPTAATRVRNCLQPDGQGCAMVSEMFACASDCGEYRPASSIWMDIHLPSLPRPGSGAAKATETVALLCGGLILLGLFVCMIVLCVRTIHENWPVYDDGSRVEGDSSPTVFLQEWRRGMQGPAAPAAPRALEPHLVGYRFPESPPTAMATAGAGPAADPMMTTITISSVGPERERRNPRGAGAGSPKLSPRRASRRPPAIATAADSLTVTGVPVGRECSAAAVPPPQGPAAASPKVGPRPGAAAGCTLLEPPGIADDDSAVSSDPVASLASVEFALRRKVGEKLGIMWVDHTVLSGVVEGSLAQREGLGDFVGCRATHVNGRPVQTLGEIQRLIQGVTTITFTLVRDDLEEGEEWNVRVPTSALPQTMLMRRTSTGHMQG